MNRSSYDEVMPSSPLGHRLMFIGLAFLAFCLFAPTVLLPILREHGELLEEEARLQRRILRLEDEVDHRAQLAVAFSQDAAINEKLAMLDLQYRRPNEEVFSVLPPEYAPPPPATSDAGPTKFRSELMLPNHWPTWAAQAETWAHEKDLIDLFLDRDLQPVFYLMSAGLVIAAFVLFAPRLPNRPRDSTAEPTPHGTRVAHS